MEGGGEGMEGGSEGMEGGSERGQRVVRASGSRSRAGDLARTCARLGLVFFAG